MIIIVGLIVLGIHIIVVSGLGLRLGEVLPLVVEDSLQFDTCQVYGCARGVEEEAIADHELEISKKGLSAGVLVAIQLLPHR